MAVDGDERVKVVFVGAHVEAREPLRFLLRSTADVRGLVTLPPDRLARMSGGVDLTADAAGVPVHLTANVNAPETVDWIAAHAPDVVVVIGWTQLLRDELLSLPRLACLGFHASLLPRYRGRAPINWALINDEPETGNTLMVLAPGADEGEIVAQRRIPITDADDCATLYQRVSETEVEMLAELLPELERGHLPRRPQDDALATVMPKRTPDDGLIDWAATARQVFNLVRAVTHPYPGAFTHVDGRRLLVWKAEPTTGPGAPDAPGAVDVVDGDVVVACGDGWVRLLRVQPEAGDETDAATVVGTVLERGTRLGGATT